MTAPGAIDPVNSSVFPLMPPRSTESRLAHFDQTVFKADPSTVIYKLVDAMCGDAGAGSLKKDTFVSRLGAALESIYFTDLDTIFGNLGVLSRFTSETYSYDPVQDMLNSDQWDEVRVKDAWYRARIREFFIACGLGGTPQGIRMAVHAATSVDADLYEVWRWKDNFGLSQQLGRSPVTARNEVVVTPHKSSLSPKEFRLVREMVSRICPADVIITVNTTGLAVNTPVIIKAAAAGSSYFEVQKTVTATPILAELPPPEVLLIDLADTEKWLLKDPVSVAPYRAFNISQESGYYYLASGGARSPIDSVEYGTLQPNGTVKSEPLFEAYESTGQYSPWVEYDKADSPDNYPGGKYGLTPNSLPALNPDGSKYRFPYENQQEYVLEQRAKVIAAGGQSDSFRFRLPIVASSTTKKTYRPDLSVAFNPPIKDSSVTSPWLNNDTPSTLQQQVDRSYVRA